jgi:hypothetical protein
VDQAGIVTAYPDPLSSDENPYPVTEPIPYDPENPEFTDPVVATPEPEREYLTAEEAIARQEAAVAAAVSEPEPPGEPPLVTKYKASYE